jgi:hypothetical protein
MAPNNDENHYDTHQYAGDQAINTRRVMNRMPDEDRSTTQDIQQSINASRSAELTPDVRMGDDRAIGDTPNWASYDSEQLYNFATQKNSPTTADDLGRAFNDGGNNLAEAANALFEAVGALDSAWSGVAADSAKSALKPLAQAAGTAGQTAQLMGVRMSQQSVAAAEVRKLPPAKTFDQQQQLTAMLAGGPAAMQADLKAQKDAADAVKREQISYLSAYTVSMSAVDAQTPSFVPPEQTIGNGSGSSSSFSGSSVYIPGTGNGTPNVTGGTTTGGPSGGFSGVAGPNGSSSPGFVDGTDQTDQAGYTPMPGLNTATSGYTPPTTAPSTFGPTGGGPGGTPMPGAGSGGFGGGFGSFGNQGAAGGAGSAAGSGSGAGSGANSGSSPRGMAPTGVSPTGSAAGRGAGGMGGGAPRGKGENEEDKEHERPSYLVEGDPESTFGSDQMTAPSVIGGDD